MRNYCIYLFISVLALFWIACGSSDTRDDRFSDQSGDIVYYQVDEVYAEGESLADQTINVRGLVEHVCRHGNNRFRMIDMNNKYSLRVDLNKNLAQADPSLVGKYVKVTGVLVPRRMDANEVAAWKERAGGEHDDDHHNEEISEIAEIYDRIISGEIPYYVTYSLSADKYEIE